VGGQRAAATRETGSRGDPALSSHLAIWLQQASLGEVINSLAKGIWTDESKRLLFSTSFLVRVGLPFTQTGDNLGGPKRQRQREIVRDGRLGWLADAPVGYSNETLRSSGWSEWSDGRTTRLVSIILAS